jgi:hypothetical protein
VTTLWGTTIEVIAPMGTLEPFDEGAHSVLPRLSGINISPSTVQRTTEAEGRRLAQRRAEGQTFGPNAPWRWRRDASGRTVAYAGLDAGGVRQQGPHGEKAEGRMPWVATVFNPQPTQNTKRRRRRQRVWESRYVSGVMSWPRIGAQLRRECRAVGVAEADLVIGSPTAATAWKMAWPTCWAAWRGRSSSFSISGT